MDLQPTTRYPSLQMSRGYDDGSSPIAIDGLDVVDEQVVLLSPLEPGRKRSGVPRRVRTPAYRTRTTDTTDPRRRRNGLG